MSGLLHDLGVLQAGVIKRTEHPPFIELQRIDAIRILISDQRRHLIWVHEYSCIIERFEPTIEASR